MILLPCPYCGLRNASEFRYVGELLTRPDPNGTGPEAWRAFLYLRLNPAGWTTETWFHRAGCRQHLVVERHTVTNEVRAARLPDAGDREERHATGGTVAEDSREEPYAESVAIPGLPVEEHPALFQGRTHGIVDYSEDVSSKDIVSAVKEGYDSVELTKRYTTATMGPAQGKLETVNTVAVLAEATGRTIEETGTTVWRPPYAPITLGALAGRIFEPVRHSPMQPWHKRHGASPLVAGAWIRPDHYGDPAAEVRNVRENVGIIDVTPLGKFDLRGPDVPKLLEMLYVNRWESLEVASVRYGVMCLEDGVIFDDGVTGRLDSER